VERVESAPAVVVAPASAPPVGADEEVQAAVVRIQAAARSVTPPLAVQLSC
jgi:hypothetical protein